jgi:ABC-type sugar transport system, permease component
MRSSPSRIAFEAFNYTFLTALSLMCLFPLLNVLAVSFSSSGPAAANQVLLWPVDFTLSSYKTMAGRPAFFRAFGISVERVALGVSINTVLTVLLAYPLSKSEKEFRARGFYMWSLIFVMIFNGGLVPLYMQINKMGMLNSIWSLVLPGAVPIFNVILACNFIKQIPKELEEAAFIDGASYAETLARVIVPVSKPVIATIVLFSFLGHWNSYFDGLIYMQTTSKYPLQTYMYTIIANQDLKTLQDALEIVSANGRTLKSAQLFLSMLPILAVYPFLQKYFAKGITLGAVKG